MAFTVFRSPRGAPGPCRAPHPTEPSGESVYSGVYSLPEPRRSRAHAPHPTEPSGESVCWRLQSAGAAAEPWDNIARARAASNRALWRKRFVAFTVFRSRRGALLGPSRAASNKALCHGESVEWRLQSSGAAAEPCWDLLARAASHRALWRERSVAFRVFRSRRGAVVLWCAMLFCVVLSCCGVLCCSVLCCAVCRMLWVGECGLSEGVSEGGGERG